MTKERDDTQISGGPAPSAAFAENAAADAANVRADAQGVDATDGEDACADLPEDVRNEIRALNEEVDRARAEAEEAKQEADRFKQEAERNWQQFLHAAADLENYKRTSAKVQRDVAEHVRRQMLQIVLSAADNLERAISYAERNQENEAVAGILDGMRIAHRSLLEKLGSIGVRPMEAEGKSFDPALHEAVAVATVEEAGSQSGTVTDVLQTGYLIGEDVLRPALVKVVK
ncbi:MAG: nucleotide exchange factor GrpE [Armatimonadetes bacterium]|nr:nucleotide exchange factor GrpE [Armatimonadota bacterium]